MSLLFVTGAGNREAATFGGGECCCAIGICLSVAGALRVLGRAASCVRSGEASRFSLGGIVSRTKRLSRRLDA